jgi:hypothetical protein
MGETAAGLGILAVQWRPEDLLGAAVCAYGGGVCDGQADADFL